MRAFTVFQRVPVLKAHTLPNATIDPQPRWPSGLRDGARLAILRLLAEDAYSVQELGTILGLGRLRSHHLKALGMRGSFGSSGTARTGSTAEPSAQASGPRDRTFATLFEELDAALGPALEAGVAQVIADRGARSRAFSSGTGKPSKRARILLPCPIATCRC